MSRRRRERAAEAETVEVTPPEPPAAPVPPAEPVLVQIERGRPLGVVLVQGGETRTAKIPLGVSFVPRDQWETIQAGPTWARRSLAGEVRALAGHDKGLAEDWAALPVRQIEALIPGCPAQWDDLSALEQRNKAPRPRVFEAIRQARTRAHRQATK